MLEESEVEFSVNSDRRVAVFYEHFHYFYFFYYCIGEKWNLLIRFSLSEIFEMIVVHCIFGKSQF